MNTLIYFLAGVGAICLGVTLVWLVLAWIAAGDDSGGKEP
jgi:hypothetical protein